MALLTGLSYQNIIDREPAIADFITDYSTSLVNRINEAKFVIDNKLRAMGYDLDKLGRKQYFYNFDNSAASFITATLTNIKSSNSLLIINDISGATPTGVVLSDALGTNYYTASTPTTYAFSLIILSLRTPQSTLRLNSATTFTANTVQAYLTDPAIYFLHLYKSLELIYQGMISNVGDLFESKAKMYREMYDSELNNLVTSYDENADGTIDENETTAIKRIRTYR